MQKSLDDFEGKESIFIDANIFLHHAFDSNNNAVKFLEKVELFQVKAYTSALVMEEVAFKLLMQSASSFLKIVTMQNVKRFLLSNKRRDEIFKPVIEYREYIDLLKKFGLIILDLTDKDIANAINNAKRYGLILADSTHLTVMERKGITNIATSDYDFKKIDNITLWVP